MGKDLLTVKDFAEKAGVSVQSIYKKLAKTNNPIQRYLKVVDGVKYIEPRALEILYSPKAASAADDEEPPVVEETPPPKQAAPQQSKNSTDRILDLLEKQLEEQRRQLLEKDRQLQEKDNQIKSLLDRLEESSKIINQQQQLTAMNTQALLERNSSTASAADEAETPPPPIEVEVEQPTQKKSIWQRIFGKE